MTAETKTKTSRGGTSAGIYGLAFIGALVYYISHASSFLMGLWGVLKAILWPAFLIYEIMNYLQM